MLYLRGKTWWCQFEHRGQRFRISTGKSNRRAAETEARRRRVEIEEEAGAGGRQQGIALEILEGLDIRRVKKANVRPGRVKDIENLWAPVLRLLRPHRDITKLTIADIEDYEGKRRKEGALGQTIRREVQAIRRGMLIAERDRIIAKQPFKWAQVDTIKSDPPDARRSGKLWTADEIAKVFAHISKRGVTLGVLDRMRLIQLTGLRLEELRRLRPSWVVDGALRVPHAGAKTRTPRQIPLPEEAIGIIERWSKKRRGRRRPKPDAPPFSGGKPDKVLRQASMEAGFKVTLTPRDLRVFYITHAGRHDVVAARDLAGHTNLATTSRYLKSDTRKIFEAAAAAASAAGALKVATKR